MLYTAITGPIGKVLSLILLMAVFGLALGVMNSWFLFTKDTGLVHNERVDRIVLKGSHTTPDEAWASVTAVVAHGGTAASVVNTSAYSIGNDSGDCEIEVSGATVGSVWYSPSGTEVTLSSATGGITGCEWDEESNLFKVAGMSQLIEIILQAAGLAGPVFLLMEVGGFAKTFTSKMGGGPVMSIVLTLVVLLLVGTMMSTFVPFLSDAYEAIDSKRFLMYDTGLGRLATVISSFFGVVLVAGLLMLGWGLWQNLKSGNLLTGGAGQRM